LVRRDLAILDDASLATTIWRGRQKLHDLNPVPINEIARSWISQYENSRVTAVSDLNRALEEQ